MPPGARSGASSRKVIELRKAPRPRRDVDAGFTVIEVVVALMLLGVVAAAALAFFVRAMQNTSHLQRSQASVAVANQAMEAVRAVNPRVVDPVSGTSGLLIGRTQAATDAAWAAAAVADTAQSNKVWDTAAASRPSVVIPVTKTTRVSDMTYKVTTLIGTCYRAKNASTTDQSCVKTNATGSVQLFRVTIVVTWTASKAGACGTGGCEYKVSTLVDPTDDANWNLTAKPVAYDDTISATAGDTTAMPTDVLVNDVIGAVTANPTTITVPPAFGTATVTTSGSGMGSITFVPGNASGETFLKYKLKDAAGRQSNEATIVITVAPKANNDATVSVEAGGTVLLNVLANDYGSGLVPVVTSSGTGSATVNGSQIEFDAPNTTGSTSVKYKAMDSSGLMSNEATINITVTAPVTPKVGNPLPTIALPYSATAQAPNLDLLAKTGNPSTFTIELTSQPSAGSVTLNPAKTVATFNQPAGLAPGTYTFGYRVANLVGQKSAVGTYTITVALPVAVDDSSSLTMKRSGTTTVAVDFSLGANDSPVGTTWGSALKIRLDATSNNTSCGQVSIKNANAGTVTLTAQRGSQQCSFTFRYTIIPSSGSGFTSNTITNTVTVNKP